MNNVYKTLVVIFFSLSFHGYSLGQAYPPDHENHRQSLPVVSSPQKIQLYKRRPKPEVDRRKADSETYPVLYSEAREKGTIVIFGASWCNWCRIQKAAIPEGYRVLYLDLEAEKKYEDLLKQWEAIQDVGVKYPTCVLSVDGIPEYIWYGFKPWAAVEDRVKKAKKLVDDA